MRALRWGGRSKAAPRYAIHAPSCPGSGGRTHTGDRCGGQAGAANVRLSTCRPSFGEPVARRGLPLRAKAAGARPAVTCLTRPRFCAGYGRVNVWRTEGSTGPAPAPVTGLEGERTGANKHNRPCETGAVATAPSVSRCWAADRRESHLFGSPFFAPGEPSGAGAPRRRFTSFSAQLRLCSCLGASACTHPRHPFSARGSPAAAWGVRGRGPSCLKPGRRRTYTCLPHGEAREAAECGGDRADRLRTGRGPRVQLLCARENCTPAARPAGPPPAVRLQSFGAVHLCAAAPNLGQSAACFATQQAWVALALQRLLVLLNGGVLVLLTASAAADDRRTRTPARRSNHGADAAYLLHS